MNYYKFAQFNGHHAIAFACYAKGEWLLGQIKLSRAQQQAKFMIIFQL